MRAARTEFGRHGYTRTSIDAIAAEAGVSTRTIYNHFAGKEQLFAAVLTSSATQVADSVVDGAARAFAPEPLDVERALVGLGLLLAAQQTDFPEHFAMVRQIDAEADHFPHGVHEAWQDAGPRRVRAEVVARLQDLADRGLLLVDNPARAATHFAVLTTGEVREASARGHRPLREDEAREMVAAGVAAFLHGYERR
jgi:AcrR family transcriptional regulator